MIAEEKPPESLVQFMCYGETIADRKSCACYIPDEEDKEFEDCKGLRNPISKERTGLCWNPRALFLKSISFLKFWDEHFGEKSETEASE